MTESLLLTAQKRVEWIREESSLPGPHEILVQTLVGAISIGSELPQYCGTARAVYHNDFPYMTGYESVGIVLACGSAVQRIQQGDRVVAFYGHRTHAIVPEEKAIVIPEDVSDTLALLMILSCDAAKGVRKIAPFPEERVLITGAGAIGLLTLFQLKAYGVTTIDVVEPCQERHELAYQLGASHAWLPQGLLATSETYSAAFECSSHNDAFKIIQNHMSHNGRICITADGNLEALVLEPTFHAKELRVLSTSDGWDYHAHANWYFRFIQQHTTYLEKLFDLHITAAALPATFEQLAEGTIRPVKILVKYTTF
jgi:alcohol dehydrogenase